MRRSLLAIAFPVLLYGNLSAQKNSPASITKQADSLVALYAAPTTPGVAVAVVQENRIVYSNQRGIANLEYDIPITDSTEFHVASVSKQFTAFLALMLEDEGKLSMDDDIRKYLPELKELPYKVNLRQLANHTNGFPNIHELAYLTGVSPQDVLTQQQVLKMLLAQRQLNFPPGTKYQYNNAGFALLAEIIQRVTGKSFAAYAQEKIFTPLGMKHTFILDDNATIVKNKAYSYKKTKEGYSKVPFNFSVYGSSGINTTTGDLARWTMNFVEPVVGSRSVIAKMETPSRLVNGQTIPYTQGLELKRHKGLDVVFHGGGDAGYRAYILRVPAQKFAVVVMGNLESFNPLDLSYGLADLYLENAETNVQQQPIPRYTTSQLSKWQGDYEFMPGSFFTLVAKNDTMFFQPFGTKELYPVPVESDSTFNFPFVPHSKLEITKNGLNFHFSDFSYPATKLKLHIPDKATVKQEQFTGIYYNDALKTTYRLIIKNNTLTATHALNNDIALKPLAKDEFYSDQSFFGKLQFIRNSRNQVTSFMLSGQNLNNIRFQKIAP